jgi:hypothetical protein
MGGRRGTNPASTPIARKHRANEQVERHSMDVVGLTEADPTCF